VEAFDYVEASDVRGADDSYVDTTPPNAGALSSADTGSLAHAYAAALEGDT
jgi:hypothetical protein